MKPLKEWLKENTLENIKNMENMDYNSCVKKAYRPLDRGNMKLERSIFSFSLIPIITCQMACSKCYDLKALHMYTQLRHKRLYNTYLAVNKLDYLEEQIKLQIKRSVKIKFVRIHVGGDYFSKEYVDMWLRIVEWTKVNKPHVTFYSYTKTGYGDLLRSKGINTVASTLPNGKPNFAPLPELRAFMAHNEGYVICPATLKQKGIKCGSTCDYCMTRKDVLFVLH